MMNESSTSTTSTNWRNSSTLAAGAGRLRMLAPFHICRSPMDLGTLTITVSTINLLQTFPEQPCDFRNLSQSSISVRMHVREHIGAGTEGTAPEALVLSVCALGMH
ncbi:hypothetical protein CERSUDRAFT_118961 [Gelatoporia subvermispora B]|uniref:Uncharacterized protein n=1 Tax=Ceriporiopsis subvermispora (strain B) TaxID=914234 RepID=M2R1Z3_CERS8|nr:hypothetical protein CERSUDRAFT_118961 [Gelatoporia subvermispora B]